VDKLQKLLTERRSRVSEQFFEDVCVHTPRGMEGILSDGRHAGGRAYT
jgi:site-specific DNA recombinase